MKFIDIYPEVARPYTACFMVLRRGNEIAMVLRKNTGWMDGYYGLPAGKGEWDEPFTVGCIREAKEEAGVDVNPEDIHFLHVVHRHSAHERGDDYTDWVDVYYEATKWEGEPYNAEEHKSEALHWIDIDKLPENIVPPQLDALRRIAKGEKYSEYGWK